MAWWLYWAQGKKHRIRALESLIFGNFPLCLAIGECDEKINALRDAFLHNAQAYQRYAYIPRQHPFRWHIVRRLLVHRQDAFQSVPSENNPFPRLYDADALYDGGAHLCGDALCDDGHGGRAHAS